MTSEPDAASERGESPAERIDRNLMELLQELRVASIGVQVLFGFLLSLPFTTRFGALDDTQRALYMVDLVAAAVATALLTGPVAQHRLTFRQHKKERLLQRASAMAIAGLVALAVAVTGSVLLVATVVSDGIVVPIVTGTVAAVIALLWFVVPLAARGRDEY
jgi:putative flippase GtrA